MPTTTRPAVAAALLAALLGLSACGSGDDAPKPLGDGSPSSSPSSSTSPSTGASTGSTASSPSGSPSVEPPAGVPTTPPQAPPAAGTVAGAKAYGEYVTRLVDYASSARDYQAFASQLAPGVTCQTCTELKGFIDDLAEKQQWVVGTPLTISRSGAQAVKGQPGVFQSVTFFDYPNKRRIDASGRTTSYKQGSQKFVCGVTAKFAAGAWQVRGFQFQAVKGQQ